MRAGLASECLQNFVKTGIELENDVAFILPSVFADENENLILQGHNAKRRRRAWTFHIAVC